MDKKHREKIAAWRDAVMERDGHRCLVCAASRGEAHLTAHHCLPRSYSRKYIYDVNNGATLCWQSGCFAHDRAHLLQEPYLWIYFDGQQITWTDNRDAAMPRREVELALANAA